MKQLIVMVLCGWGISGCATMASYQRQCETEHPVFIEMVPCLRNAVVNDSRRNNPDAKLYLLKADQLREKVIRGEMTELDARVELQTLYVQLHQNAIRTRAATINCYTYGDYTQCY